MSGPPAFSEALLRAKKAYNAQANREGRPMLAEHDLEEAVWAVYELLRPEEVAYELVGGPFDGEVRTLSRKPEGWEYYIVSPPLDGSPIARDASARDNMRERTYVVRYDEKGGHPRMIWQGDKVE